MKIHLITPAGKNSRNGNRTSAMRWARLLRELGHQVCISTDYLGEKADLVIALHAWHSAAAIVRYRDHNPSGLLVVALGGTDVNHFLDAEPKVTLGSMRRADRLVCLHDLIAEDLPVDLHSKLTVIRQSALPLPRARQPSRRYFQVCVIGHLRQEKDPFRAAKAARLLPADSRVRVMHYGKAHSDEWAQQAEAEMQQNPRYLWRGEVSAGDVRQALIRSQVMVISSLQEGGANVVSEAVVGKVPVIASDIKGNIGLLGKDYPGYFAVEDEKSLAAVLRKAETSPKFLQSLEQQIAELAPLFTPEQEASAWGHLLSSMK